MSNIFAATKLTINQAATALLNGNLVAFPTETVYGLGADANNEKAILRIYEVKKRPKNHPIIVHISSEEIILKWARNIPDYAFLLARRFWPGPMTLILTRTKLAKDFITGGQDCVGLRIPNHKVAINLLAEFESLGGFGVAAPSANLFGKLSPTTADAVAEELGEQFNSKDFILDGGMCNVGLESTIVDCRFKQPKVLRAGAITNEMIEEVTGLKLVNDHIDTKIRVSGSLKSHYSPNADIYLEGIPSPGDGFIALSCVKTPKGAVRLASPEDDVQYAQILYHALRQADKRSIKRVFVILPQLGGISTAIIDRLERAAYRG